MQTRNFTGPIWAVFTVLALSLAFISGSQAGLPPGNPPQDITPLDLGGDNPLSTLKIFDGPVNVVVDVVAQSGVDNPSGTFTISGIPAGATTLRAWFITTSFSSSSTESATANFAGTSLGTKSPDVTDPGGGLFCREYRFDVTSLVAGNGNYDYSVNGTSNTYGDALVVIYMHVSLPVRKIVVNDGAESLQQATSTTTFAGFSAGEGQLIVFTQADNVSGGNESITFNGSIVLGPGDIFNGNQGDFASLIDIPVTVVDGTNIMDVTTEEDWFGLHIGILIGPPCPFEVITSDAGVLDSLRKFRDEALAESEIGQYLIGGYYYHSPEIVQILLRHPMLSIRSAVILKRVMPGIYFLLGDKRGRDIVMTRPLVTRIQKLFADISEEGSDDLVDTLSWFSEMLDASKGMRISEIWQVLKEE